MIRTFLVLAPKFCWEGCALVGDQIKLSYAMPNIFENTLDKNKVDVFSFP